MTDVLFIKTSSLGDVINHMPAVTEARARRPGLTIDWVVERAFAPLVGLHAAVHEVIPIGERDWRKAWYGPSVWREMRGFFRTLHARRYDAIIDSQGLLMKSVFIARAARGVRHGYDAKSIKEPVASWFYDVRHSVEWNQHAIVRNRALTGLALGYEPQGAPDYGLDRSKLAEPSASPYAVLLHGTAVRRKEWSEANWHSLAAALSRDIGVVLPFGSERERGRSQRIAAAAPRAKVFERQPIDAVARLIAGAAFVVGVDTGLTHLAAALGVPLVAIFTGSEARLNGPVGSGPIAVLGANGAPPPAEEVAQAAVRIRA